MEPGSYDPKSLSQDQRQALWEYFGHTGIAPAGYGGEGGGGGGAGGGTPAFSFDYAAEATKAYGELGPYYERLLTESKGDMNKVLARLVQDYDRGVRIKREDVGTEKEAIAQAQLQANRANEQGKTNIADNALSRGLLQKSAFATPGEKAAPETGFGIADVNFAKQATEFGYGNDIRAKQATALDTGLARYLEAENIQKERTTTDVTEEQKRKEINLEEQRKEQAASLANLRGSNAYNAYSASAALT